MKRLGIVFVALWAVAVGTANALTLADLEKDGIKKIQDWTHGSVSYAFWQGPPSQHHGKSYVRRYLQQGELIVPLGYFLDRTPLMTGDIKDDIVILGNSVRRLDLRCLRGESFFQPKPPLYVSDTVFAQNQGKNEYEVDSRKTVERLFPDLVDTYGRQPSLAYPLQSEDEPAADRLRRVLARPERASALVLGEPGTGKSEFIKSFARAVAEGKYPEIPRTIRIYYLDAGQFEQGANLVGVYDTRLKVLLAMARSENTLLFMDEIQSLLGVGTHSFKPADIFSQILPHLADGSVRLLATSNEYSFYAAFGGDEAFLRRFGTPIRRQPSSDSQLLALAAGFVDRFSTQPIPDESVREGIRYSNQFNPYGAQPAKLMDLLGEVVADSRLQQSAEEVTPVVIRDTARRLYQIPEVVWDVKQREQILANLPGVLDTQVVGQAPLKRTLVRLLRRSYLQVTDLARPPVRVLVIGPKGVGKTQTAHAAARALGLPAKEINMNDLTDGERSVDEFKRLLAAGLKENPFTFFILDELSLAHPAVQDVLRQIFVSGSLTVAERFGPFRSQNFVQMDFRNASFVATANSGASSILERFLKNQNAQSQFTEAELRDWAVAGGIPEPLVDRFAAVVEALPATRAEFHAIVRQHVEARGAALGVSLQRRIAVRNLTEFVEYASQRYYRPGMSNRIAQSIASVVDEAVLQNIHATEDASDLEITLPLEDHDADKYEDSGETCAELLRNTAP